MVTYFTIIIGLLGLFSLATATSVNMIMYWEVILLFFLATPIYLYARHNKFIISCFGLWCSLMVLTRIGINVCLVDVANVTDVASLDMNTDFVRQFYGVFQMALYILWEFYVAMVLYANLLRDAKNAKTVEEVGTSKPLRLANNLFSTTVWSTFILAIISLFVYHLESRLVNMVVFIVVIFAIALAMSMNVGSTLQATKKKLLDAESAKSNEDTKSTESAEEVKDDLEFINLDEEDEKAKDEGSKEVSVSEEDVEKNEE